MPDTRNLTRNPAEDLQAQLDSITQQTRALVQAERLAITDTHIAELLDSGVESRILRPGAQAPSFALQDATSSPLKPGPHNPVKLIRSDDLLAIGPLILKFFRGRWCPYDMTELEAWQALYPQVRERGALLVAISPQLPRQNDFTTQRHNLTFPVLADPAATLATEFGLTYTVPEPMQRHYRSILVNVPFINGDHNENTWRLPLPATIVIAQSGKILYAEAHADHRVRPNPMDALAFL